MFRNLAFLAFAFLFSFSAPLQAQEAEQGNFIYEKPTMKTLSQLYWALSKFELDDDRAIDNFLFINECDLYKEYINDEFEWKGLREGGRQFIEKNRTNFSTRFELLQPLKFGEYDLETHQFDIQKKYKIDGIRSIEVLASDAYVDTCDRPYRYDIAGYPRGLNVELNRPIILDKILIDPEVAQFYIKAKNAEAEREERKYKSLYGPRDAYLLLKIRIFSFKQDIEIKGRPLSKVLGILEGYEIYADRERKMLLFSESFRRKKTRSKMEIELKKRYQERLKKQIEEKRRVAEEAAKAGIE